MQVRSLSSEDHQTLESVLGYLNYSSGTADASFLGGLNRVFEIAEDSSASPPQWRRAWDILLQTLEDLSANSPAFKDATQARGVLTVVADHVLPGYLAFHQDLLFHRREEELFNSFFLGRVLEAVLQQGGPWDEVQRIADAAITQLNDYIGHRPVAALESQKIEPYRNEWVRPIPLYVVGAGAASGPYREVVEKTIQLLGETDEDILRDAYFDPDQLIELAIDPRAYDFDHPVNKRPNYHFGQWDPHQIDSRGYYNRYVIQQVTLDALMHRLQDEQKIPREELLFEAAAVLTGTIIMSTGISGFGPETHDSSVSLAGLLPKIAAYRDEFYERLLKGIDGGHGQRLRKEAAKRRQPFGGARQHLNASLARQRASQLEHVHLAAIFARVGFPEAAIEQANIVPAASARMLCQIDCRLTSGDLAVQAGRLDDAANLLDEIMDWLHRGIQCGAIVDPWNILGFDANFSLFPALENSVRDHRCDEVVVLMEQVFALYSRVWSEAAARDDGPLRERIAARFQDVAAWWRKFAVHEVSSVDAIDVQDAYQAAELVAHALNLWHKGGASVDDIRFWAPHADMFDSPKAYALVIGALLERDDFVASMALLVHWLGQADRIGIEKGDVSFCQLAERWMLKLRRKHRRRGGAEDAREAWRLARKFLDYLEANADELWQVPSFDLLGGGNSDHASDFDDELDEELEDEEDSLFSAAYEDVVYRDSTDDGVDSQLEEFGQASDDEILMESRRLNEHLVFISSVARLWQLAGSVPVSGGFLDSDDSEIICRWILQSTDYRRQLRDLLQEVNAMPLPNPSGDHDSMVEYDRVRLIRESILEQVITTCVEVADASRLLAAAVQGDRAVTVDGPPGLAEDEQRAREIFAAILHGDADRARRNWDVVIRSLLDQPLLYVPLAKDGDPNRIVTARIRQRMIQDLLAWLPRIGLIRECCELIETAREMERRHSVGPGAVTEFDELFKIGYKSLVKMIVHSSGSWKEKGEAALVECLKDLTQALLSSWLAHSKTLRLSVLERVKDKREWAGVVAFVDRYGADIFTQRFLNLANLRAILHQGAEHWLEQLLEEYADELDWKLLRDLEQGKLTVSEAADWLSLVLEAVAENYGEYRDYNSMTTQSDRGELLYMLLDFLRLRTQYDRICWQLKPVVWAHEILVRRGHEAAAQMWYRELSEQTRHQAKIHLDQLSRMQAKYAIRMPTVADRVAERFVRPMIIDGICALVRQAIKEARQGGDHPAFDRLAAETEELTREPTGVGLDVPAWLVALEEEVEAASQDDPEKDRAAEIDAMIPQKPLSLKETRRQLESWNSR